ncbi:MAG: DUF934 domain-containing protein [Gammaproteobacteria bacterium]|nr:DUF934 domain-containing protein [Gammaproteobacteria bacterium]
MRIIKNRAVIRDPWRLEEDGGSDAASDARVILPLQRYLKMRHALCQTGRRVGVKLRPEDEVESIAGDLGRIDLIALEFGSFHEGRGYSQAVQLRRRHRYDGEIRALGAHRDNLPLMERCGIDAYQLAEGEDIEEALEAFAEITEYYSLSG